MSSEVAEIAVVAARPGQFQQLLKIRVILILNFTRLRAITYTNMSLHFERVARHSQGLVNLRIFNSYQKPAWVYIFLSKEKKKNKQRSICWYLKPVCKFVAAICYVVSIKFTTRFSFIQSSDSLD